MPLENIIERTADISLLDWQPEPVVMMNDDITFVYTVQKDGNAFPLTNVSIATLACTRRDGKTIITNGIIDSMAGTISFEIGRKETAVDGRTQLVIQLYDIEQNRVSTIRGSMYVQLDPTGDTYEPLTEEKTLLEQVLFEVPVLIEASQTATLGANQAADKVDGSIQEVNNKKLEVDAFLTEKNTAFVIEQDTRSDVFNDSQFDREQKYSTFEQQKETEFQTVIQNVNAVADSNKTRFLTPPVNTFAQIATQYPTPLHGDTIQVKGENAIYRFETGLGWKIKTIYDAVVTDYLSTQIIKPSNTAPTDASVFWLDTSVI